jgi:hypothetical protein
VSVVVVEISSRGGRRVRDARWGGAKKVLDERAGQTCMVGRWSLDDPTAARRLLASDHSALMSMGVRILLIHGVDVVRIGSRTAAAAVTCQEMIQLASAANL